MEIEGFKSVTERAKRKPCAIGENSGCCRICLMGPCRLTTPDAIGVCGASRNLVVARNLLRMAASGAASHASHATHLMHFFQKSLPQNYAASKAPEGLMEIWKQVGLSVAESQHGNFEILTEALHLSTMGVDSDYQDVAKWLLAIGLVDGYAGLYPATELEDKHFGKPKIQRGFLNLACVDPEKINIAVHGHEPFLVKSLARLSAQFPHINLVGVCCTGTALLAKHGIPQAAHFILQEDVVATGVIEAMVVDVQCIMPSLSDLCECFHTKLITTNPIGRIPGALHMPITSLEQAEEMAARILEIAIANRKNRKSEKQAHHEMPQQAPREVVVGFSEENLPLEDFANQIKSGAVKGIIAVVGCVNPRVHVANWIKAFHKLSEHYIILTTGCMAFEFGQHGLLDGTRIFHLGSCVNNARVAEVFKRVAELCGKSLPDMPYLVSAPASITEKCFSIGLFFAALGTSIHLGYHKFMDAEGVGAYIAKTLHHVFKSRVLLEEDAEIFPALVHCSVPDTRGWTQKYTRDGASPFEAPESITNCAEPRSRARAPGPGEAPAPGPESVRSRPPTRPQAAGQADLE